MKIGRSGVALYTRWVGSRRSSEFERKEVEIVRVASKNLHEMI